MDLLVDLFQTLLVIPITNILVALARIFGGNFGVAIVVFTLLMRLVTWPLTSSQYKASRAMQAIQPQMQELQKKYKGKDPKKLQSETMALYREAGVNPLGCLLPLLVQMPIWIALYQVILVTLGESPESLLRLSNVLYPIGFVREGVPLNNSLLYWNLGRPDTSFLLPFLVAATMYVQQKLVTPPPTPAATQAAQQQQQTMQMMTWMMPLMFGFWSISVPSGLALYWFVSNLSGIVLQYFYLGRKVDWRNVLSIGPRPAPAKPGARPEKRAAERPAKEAKQAEPEAEEAEGPETPQAEPPARPAQARRKRHGRRRSKR